MAAGRPWLHGFLADAARGALAAVADVALEYRPGHVGLDPVRYAVARRLDDLAYGSGVWLSAVRGRSTAALRPRSRLRNGSPA